MKINFKNILPVFIICFFGILFHYQHMNDFPSHIHSWAQSDRYAISKNFVNNGLNLFEPETYLMNPQFPHFWEVPNKESITSVDFPIHDYIPAVFMKVTGIDSPWVVRLYNLLYSFLGLFFLYKLALFYLKNEIKALFILIFSATSPVFLFYQNSFIPSIPSLANAIIGVYFYAKYSANNKNKNFNLALLFVTIAGLSRTTFIIPLIAILCVEFVQIIRRKSSLKPKFIPVLISFFTLFGYYIYNKYLRSLYGSSFLDTLMNADDIESFITKIKLSIDSWGTQYFSSFHYSILTALVISSILFYLFKRQKKTIELQKFNFYIIVLILGNIFFLIAMAHQFILHDYYFLDSFYLPFVLLLISLLSFVPNPNVKWAKISFALLILAIGFVFAKNGVNSQRERYTYKFWEEGEFVVENYKMAEEALISLGYEKDAKVLIFESFAPNLPFLVMDRKGFTITANRISTINKALNWDYDVIVIQNEQFVSTILPTYPGIINKMTKIWGNDRITICKPKENNLSFNSFFELDKKKALIQSSVNIANRDTSSWQNTVRTILGDSSSAILIKTKNGPIFSRQTSNFFKTDKTMFFEGKFKLPETHKTSIIISISNQKGENLYYKIKDLKNLIPTNNKWNTMRLWLNIPVINEEFLEFKLYINNRSKSTIYLDDLSIRLFETSD